MAVVEATQGGTADRILVAAMAAFGTRGFEATSLDDLAGELGIRKQTILYWFPSKDVLLEAVVDRCAAEVTGRLERGLAGAGEGFGRVAAMVRVMFRLAARPQSMSSEGMRVGKAGSMT